VKDPAGRLRAHAQPCPQAGTGGPREQVTSVRCRLEVRLTPADAGQRVVIRWRWRSPDGGEQIAGVLGILEESDADSFAVRTPAGQRAAIPSTRAAKGPGLRDYATVRVTAGWQRHGLDNADALCGG
jgi:hypothetical protein